MKTANTTRKTKSETLEILGEKYFSVEYVSKLFGGISTQSINQNMTTVTPATFQQKGLKQYFALCNRLGFPHFFINDFLKYQEKKKWSINGKDIENPLGVFVAWAKGRRQSMIENGIWRGAKTENWDLTPAVFMGYKKPYNPKNKLYIESLITKVNKGEPLNDQEKDHADQMGIIVIIESLKEKEPDNLNATPKRIICENCHLIDFSYLMEKTQFCPRCRKYTNFTLKKDF